MYGCTFFLMNYIYQINKICYITYMSNSIFYSLADFITITNTIYNITFEEEEKTRLLRGSLSDWHVTYKRFSVDELARFSPGSNLVVHFYIFCCVLMQCHVSRRFF